MTYTVLPLTGCGDLFPDCSSGQWLPECLCLNNSLPQPEVSQVLPLFFTTASYCAWWTNFSTEKMLPGWGERHRVMLSLTAGQELLWALLGAFECQISPHQPGLQAPLTDLPYEEPYLHTGSSSPDTSFTRTGFWSGQGQAPGTPKHLPCVSSALDFGRQTVPSGQILCEQLVMRGSFSTLGYKPLSQ